AFIIGLWLFPYGVMLLVAGGASLGVLGFRSRHPWLVWGATAVNGLACMTMAYASRHSDLRIPSLIVASLLLLNVVAIEMFRRVSQANHGDSER
ncbi:MAG TPA: hypothetical protein VNH80_13180, partial [Burkholderiales bacterium]|nr:hypothetical protein [Burkholderiales bacterium]